MAGAQDDPGEELFQGGRAPDDPEENCSRAGEPKTIRRRFSTTSTANLLEGLATPVAHAKEKDVIMFSTGRKICLVGHHLLYHLQNVHVNSHHDYSHLKRQVLIYKKVNMEALFYTSQKVSFKNHKGVIPFVKVSLET